MFGLYFLVAIATQFIAGIQPVGLTTLKTELSIETSFSSISNLKIGSPVTIRGELIGTVSKIEKIEKQLEKGHSRKNKNDSYFVQLQINNPSCISDTSIALVATPVVTNSSKKQSVIEILTPQSTSNSQRPLEKLRGFSSYKEFWLASDIKSL